MTSTSTPHYIDGHAQAVRDHLQFDKFAVAPDELSLDEINMLLQLPQVDSGCLIKTNPNKSGSAFSQMKEHAIIAGFMRSHDRSLKALVVYTERPCGNDYEYGFVSLSQIKHVKKVASV